MTTQENQILINRYYQELWSQGNLAVADEMFDPQASLYSPADPDGIHGVADLKAFVNRIKASFPDLTFTIQDIVAARDKVACRWAARGSHQGVYATIPPTGKVITVEGVDLFYVAEGKITQIMSYIDVMGLVAQVGVSFPPALNP